MRNHWSNGALRWLPGNGLLVRRGALVLICQAAPEFSSRTTELVRGLEELGAENAGGPELHTWLDRMLADSTPGHFPSLGAFGPTDGGTVVLLHGDARLTAQAVGTALHLEGSRSLRYVEYVLPDPVRHLRITVDEIAGTAERASGLDAGLTIAGGVELWSTAEFQCSQCGSTACSCEAEPVTDAAPTRTCAQCGGSRCSCAAEVDVPSDTASCARCGASGGCGCASGESAGAVEPAAIGITCAYGHFNDTSVAYCTTCGISMAHGTGKPRLGTPPQLGVLVLRSGAVHPLRTGFVLGRSPQEDLAVRRGEATALPIEGGGGQVSAAHARIDSDGWDLLLTDLASGGGTQVLRPQDKAWSMVPPEVPVVIAPGTQVSLGGELACTYESPRRN